MSLTPPQLFEPAGLSIAGNTMYVADTNNHRVLAVDLATHAAREFVIDGLSPPQPATVEQPQPLAAEAVDVPAQRIKSGDSLRVKIAFELPEGFKLNQLGPVTYTLRSVGEQSLIAGEQLGVRTEAEKGDHEATITVPLAQSAGKGTYELAVTYTFCRDGTGGVCRFGKQTWRLPVEVAGDAEATEVSLTASP
jgi:hypothetical protein